MPWRNDLFDPIPGENPCGADLRYEPVYDDIKEARREDVDAPQGDWQHERKVADWPLVIRLCGDLLAKKSKDLQLAVWLTEAMLRREGYSGLKGGLDFCAGLLDKFWDNLYPEMEDGDAEIRAAPLEWMGMKLDAAVKSVPLNPAGHDWFRYTDSRSVPSEESVKNDAIKQAARKKIIDGGKLAPEVFDKSVEEAPKAFYKQIIGEIDGCLASLKKLGALCDEKFGDASPSFGGLRKPLEEVRLVVHPILKKKLELDPDPPEEEPVPESAEQAEATGGAAGEGEAAAEGGAGTITIEPANRNDAVTRVAAVARYLRKLEPSNPASYLMLRGLRWGEVRAAGSHPRARLLEAPITAVRTQLKSLLLDQKWPELLETAETAMAQPCGRGWMDLQRYAITACDHLGETHQLVGAAIRAAMLEYLRAVPELPSMTMMDDTPTANDETRAWLALETKLSSNGAGPGENSTTESESEPMQGAETFELAMDAVRSGNAERGITLLMNQLSRESSTRGRFRCRTQLAAVLVAAGREPIALPILQDLAAQIEAFKLEDWESGDVVAQPLVLLHRCLSKLNGDAATLQNLYLRICRLDPLQAIQCAQV